MSVFSAATVPTTAVVVAMFAAATAAATTRNGSGRDVEPRHSLSPRTVASTAQAVPDRLILSMKGCDELSVPEVREMMAAELGGPQIQIAGTKGDERPPTGAATAVTVTCAGGEAAIAIEHGDGDRPATRTLSLLGTALIARPQVVALAVTELLFADRRRRNERSLQRAPKTPPPAKAAAAPAAPIFVATASHAGPTVADSSGAIARQSRAEHLGHLEARGSAVVFANAPVLWGGGIGYQHLVRAPWGLAAHLDLHHGLRQTTLGDVSADVISVTAIAYGQIAARDVTWQVGIGVDLGAGRLRGTPGTGSAAQGNQLRRPLGGLLARAAALVSPVGRLAMSLTAEVGWTLLPLRAQVDGDDAVELRGLLIGLSLGIGVEI